MFTKFSVDLLEFFIEKTTFDEICEQLHREKEFQFNDEKELINSIHWFIEKIIIEKVPKHIAVLVDIFFANIFTK